MKNLLGMIPGMAAHRKELEMFDEKEVDRTEAIIRSMTPSERRDPSIIDGSRRARIAYGSGTTVSAVNGLLQRFEQAAKMMKRMANGTRGGMPGFGGPAAGGGKKGKKGGKKKSRSKSGKRIRVRQETAESRTARRSRRFGGPAASESGRRTGRFARPLTFRPLTLIEYAMQALSIPVGGACIVVPAACH